MAQLVAKKGSIKGVEVRGEVLLGLLEGMGVFKKRAIEILNKTGIDNPEEGKWYPLEALLYTFENILQNRGEFTLKKIGASVIDNAKWPENVNTFEKAIASVDVAYHMNHRRNGKELFNMQTGKIIEGQIGHNRFYPSSGSGNTAIYECGSFYPCDFDLGMVEALAKRFKPSGALFVKVIHDDQKPCRKKGGDTCTYNISW